MGTTWGLPSASRISLVAAAFETTINQDGYHQEKDGDASREAGSRRGTLQESRRRALRNDAEIARSRRRSGAAPEGAPQLGGRTRGFGEEVSRDVLPPG